MTGTTDTLILETRPSDEPTPDQTGAAPDSELLSEAVACIQGGVSIVPIDHKTKSPVTNLLPNRSWKPYQSAIADEATVRQWFAAGIQAFAVVGGKVSGGLLILDFDVAGFYDRWSADVGELVHGLPVQRTGGGGYQVLLRCPEPGGNLKLAWTPDEEEASGRTVAIETRGEGGYAVVAPSRHPTGTSYQWCGPLTAAHVPTITQEHAEKLLAAARALDEAPLTRQEQERLEAEARDAHRQRGKRPNGEPSIIDAFNEGHPIEALLECQGYVKGRRGRYIRPGGKSESVSVKDGRSCHWSSNDPLNDGRGKGGCGCHDAFDVYAHVEHGGDVSHAVRAAAETLGMAHACDSSVGRGGGSTVSAATPSPVLIYRPFPVDVLPGPVRRLVEEASASIGCDPAYVALPLLAGLSGAIGNSRSVRIKADWCEPAVLWLALVAVSGTAKSPAYRIALRAVFNRQKRLWLAYKSALEKHAKAVKEWKATPKAERGEEPEPPSCEHAYCGDVTVEALAMRIGERGLMVTVDELAGWFKNWNAYKSGGSDRENYLSFYDAHTAKIDRKTSFPPTIFISRAFVSITGGIQPGVLRRLLDDDLFDSGLAARLLFACPPEAQVRWREETTSEGVLADVEGVFDYLWSLRMEVGENGPEPVELPLTAGAYRLMVDYVNRNGEELAAMGDDRMKAVWGKLRGVAARLALVLQCTAAASGEPGRCAQAVDEISMAGGIRLAEWFGYEAQRLYGIWGESDGDRDRRQLVELIQRKGGAVTARELQQASRRCRTASDAEKALSALAQAGVGRWEPQDPSTQGGRPTRVFRLDVPAPVYTTPQIPAPLSTKPPMAGAKTGFVDVDTVDAPKIKSADWGEV